MRKLHKLQTILASRGCAKHARRRTATTIPTDGWGPSFQQRPCWALQWIRPNREVSWGRWGKPQVHWPVGRSWTDHFQVSWHSNDLYLERQQRSSNSSISETDDRRPSMRAKSSVDTRDTCRSPWAAAYFHVCHALSRADRGWCWVTLPFTRLPRRRKEWCHWMTNEWQLSMEVYFKWSGSGSFCRTCF